MSAPRTIRIEILHAPPATPEQAALRRLAEEFMACRSCSAPMQRGTQCRRCGAWCR